MNCVNDCTEDMATFTTLVLVSEKIIMSSVMSQHIRLIVSIHCMYHALEVQCSKINISIKGNRHHLQYLGLLCGGCGVVTWPAKGS